LITRAYLRQTSLNCWFLFLFAAAPCCHSHSFEFCCFGTFATSTRTSRSTDFGTSFNSQNQSSVCFACVTKYKTRHFFSATWTYWNLWDLRYVEVSGTMTMIRSPSYDGISPMEKNKSVQEQGIPQNHCLIFMSPFTWQI
jgi:hypothetical protein